MLLTTDHKVSELLRVAPDTLRRAVRKSHHLYPKAAPEENIHITILKWAAHLPSGNLGELMDFLQRTAGSEEARMSAMEDLARQTAERTKAARAKQVFTEGAPVLTPLLDQISSGGVTPNTHEMQGVNSLSPREEALEVVKPRPSTPSTPSNPFAKLLSKDTK